MVVAVVVAAVAATIAGNSTVTRLLGKARFGAPFFCLPDPSPHISHFFVTKYAG
jgi:hypothetical protein